MGLQLLVGAQVTLEGSGGFLLDSAYHRISGPTDPGLVGRGHSPWGLCCLLLLQPSDPDPDFPIYPEGEGLQAKMAACQELSDMDYLRSKVVQVEASSSEEEESEDEAVNCDAESEAEEEDSATAPAPKERESGVSSQEQGAQPGRWRAPEARAQVCTGCTGRGGLMQKDSLVALRLASGLRPVLCLPSVFDLRPLPSGAQLWEELS